MPSPLALPCSSAIECLSFHCPWHKLPRNMHQRFSLFKTPSRNNRIAVPRNFGGQIMRACKLPRHEALLSCFGSSPTNRVAAAAGSPAAIPTTTKRMSPAAAGRRTNLPRGRSICPGLPGGRHAATFPAAFPFLKLDRIYVRGLEIKNISCLSQTPWRELSDHLGLTAELGFNEKN